MSFENVDVYPMTPRASLQSSSTLVEDRFSLSGLQEDSPYPEVRAAVPNTDDPNMPAMTLRMWIIGLTLSILSSSANVFFVYRYPSPVIQPFLVLLLAHPIGKLLAFTLPDKTVIFSGASLRLPSCFRGHASPRGKESFRIQVLDECRVSLNPGPWSIKEHALIYIMSNVTNVPPYAQNAIVVSGVYYNIKRGFGFQLLFTLTTQLWGFGLAGICRRFLIWPATMVWPSILPVCALLNTLHSENEFIPPPVSGGWLSTYGFRPRASTISSAPSHRRRPWDPRRWFDAFKWIGSTFRGELGMTRYQFLVTIMVTSFIWFFLPGFLWTGLSVFSWVCWIAPHNVVVNQLFGCISGLGMGFVTFDWTQISAWNGSPLVIPWWAQCHIFLGFTLFSWVAIPVLYYTDVWHFSYFPMYSTSAYDRYGRPYDIQRILTPQATLDVQAYEDYSPPYLPAGFTITYIIGFTIPACVLVHTALYHSQWLLSTAKRMKTEADDIHMKLMRQYLEVPHWWYATVLLLFFLLGVALIEIWHTDVPIYLLILSVILPALYIVPSGLILAATGEPAGINVLAEAIPGAISPGNPFVNMLFKTFAVQTLVEAEEFLQDLKLGHYLKIPPRATFIVQLVATSVAACFQTGVKEWLFTTVHDICTPNQKAHLTCPHNDTFFTASVIWGLIGPSRLFGQSGLYQPVLYALLVGALLPFPFWVWRRKYPNSRIPFIHTPLLLLGVAQSPPAVGINYSSWFATGFVFQYLIRKRNFEWWSKYNYIASSALDSGTFLAILVIFFCLQYPKGGFTLSWWGNDVWKNTADAQSIPLRQAPSSGIPGT